MKRIQKLGLGAGGAGIAGLSAYISAGIMHRGPKGRSSGGMQRGCPACGNSGMFAGKDCPYC